MFTLVKHVGFSLLKLEFLYLLNFVNVSLFTQFCESFFVLYLLNFARVFLLA